ncbi:MAG TPA: hypothetical protein VNJ08_17745 [Bacteriovoracaceae bacterium]|nr:hypothetical protein [Bacteriovoracaceae bacterium]
MKRSLAMLFLLSISPTVLAQYAGTVNDLNAIFDPPMNITSTICSATYNNGNEHDDAACADGVNAARWMAEKYAKGAGKYMGCLDGYYQGIWDGYLQGKNPTVQMNKEAESYVAGARFDSAISRASAKALQEGETVSANQIINRYRDVIGVRDAQGRAVLPNKSYADLKITFNGFNDGYEFDMANNRTLDFNEAINAGYVQANSSFEQKVAARTAMNLQRSNAKSLCDVNQTIFGRRSMPTVTIWDFFKARRQYDFSKFGWANADWAFEIFEKDERTLEQYATYSRLNNLEKTVTETIPTKISKYKLDATGNPIRKTHLSTGAPAVVNGQPVFEMEEVITGYRTETNRVKLSSSDVSILQQAYRNSFKVSYDRYYAKQYASQNYHSEGTDKYKTAQTIGILLGQEVATQIAKQEAYNKQYLIQSASKYAEEAKRRYKQSFDRLIRIFESNSVVELNEAVIVGNEADSIFRPGEELKVNFTVTNLGEASNPVTFVMDSSADVQASNKGFVFNPAPLAREAYNTSVLGRINPGQMARNQISVGMGIINPGDMAEVGTAMNVRKGQAIRLGDYAEIENVAGGIDPINGNFSMVVNVTNPSSILSPSVGDLELHLDGVGLVEKIAFEQLGPKSTKSLVMNVTNFDPIALISSGRISGTVATKLAGRTVHKKPFEFSVDGNKERLIIAYFDALVTNKTQNSGNESVKSRISTLIGMINKTIAQNVSDRLRWKTANELNTTILPDLQRIYDQSTRAGLMIPSAQASYDLLASALAKNVKGLKARGWFNDGRHQKAFLREISYFSKKISLKPKDYKNS